MIKSSVKTLNVGSHENVNLFNISYEFDKKIDMKDKRTHNILLIDTSYSMHNDIEELLCCVKKAIVSMYENDLVSVIAFNDKAKIVLSDLIQSSIIKSIDTIFSEDNFRCEGCTCFYNAMEKVKSVYETTKDTCKDLNILLFTDGMSVCDVEPRMDYYKSNSIIDNMKTLLGCNLINFSAIGFRSYVNTDFLYEITSSSKLGSYILSNDIKDYNNFFKTNYLSVKDTTEESVTFKFDEKNEDDVYTLYSYGSSLSKTKLFKGSFTIDALNKIKNRFSVIKISDSPISNFKINDVEFNPVEIDRVISKPSLMKTLFGFVKELYYNKYQSLALDISLYLKERKLVNSIMNSFTIDEKRETFKFMKDLYIYPKYRYENGYLSTDIEEVINNQYCILDLLKDMSNLGFEYIPIRNSIYNRVSSKTVNLMDNVIRENTKDKISADMRNLVFNETRLNISIPYIINCTAYISEEDQKEYNLASIIPTKKYRNETLILNGNLNIERFKVKAPEKLFNNSMYLNNYKKLIDYLNKSTHSYYDNTYIIDLKKNPLPVVSRGYKCMDENELLMAVYELAKAKARQKVYNAEIEDAPNSVILAKTNSFGVQTGRFEMTELNETQLNILKEHYGINEKLDFVGIPTVVKGNDKYSAISIKLGIAGSSSIPSIKAFKEKEASGRKLNLMETSMKEAYDNINECNGNKLALNELKNKNKSLIQSLSSKISVSKIAKFLTGDTWSKFETNEKGKEVYSCPDLLEGVEMVMDTKWIEVEI